MIGALRYIVRIVVMMRSVMTYLNSSLEVKKVLKHDTGYVVSRDPYLEVQGRVIVEGSPG